MRWLTVGLLVVMLAGPAHADDRGAPLDGPTIRTSLAVARQFWGRVPACAMTVYESRRPGAAGFAPLGGCWVAVRLPPAPMTPYDKVALCRTVVHEFGHALGYEHSKRPRSAMGANGTTPRGCMRRFTPRLYRVIENEPRWFSLPIV